MALVFATGWLLAACGAWLVHRGEILPGTSVAGIDLGGLTSSEARERLRALELSHEVSLRAGREAVTVRSNQVGFEVDLDASVAAALHHGRDGVADALMLPVRLADRTQAVAPRYQVDRGLAGRVVAALARLVDRRPHPGGFTEWPAMAIIAPQAGVMVDRARARGALLAAFAERHPTAEAPLREVPAPPIESVRRLVREARSYVSGAPLVLTGAGRRFRLGPARLATLLKIERIGVTDVKLGVNDRRIEALVARVAAIRDRAPVDARVTADVSPRWVVESQGDFGWRPRPAATQVRPGRIGRALRRNDSATAIRRAIRERAYRATLAVEALPPRISTAAARRVRSLIGTFTTHFECCQPRVRNIRLIGRAIDGTLVAPGEQFSLNGVAGERTRAGGYVPAPFIADGRLVPSVGGGVSQVSTTMYNAAFFAGLRLDAHQPHSFYIDRYPPGREATLDFDSIDLRWTNDTDTPVLVRATATDTSVTVALFGDNGGRRVSAETGARRLLPGRDFEITVTRVVRYPDGRVARESYTTSYDEPPEE